MPPSAKKASKRLTLLKSLQANSVVMARQALQEDPEAASTIFWDNGCEPPLCAAVRLRCGVPIVQLLLEHGADPMAVNPRGQTPLALLSERKQKDMLKPLIVEFPGISGCSASTWSKGSYNENDTLEVASELMRFGADPACPDAHGQTALDLAAAAENQQLVDVLERRQAVKVLAMLHRASASGHGDMAVLPVAVLSKLAPFLSLGL